MGMISSLRKLFDMFAKIFTTVITSRFSTAGNDLRLLPPNSVWHSFIHILVRLGCGW